MVCRGIAPASVPAEDVGLVCSTGSIKARTMTKRPTRYILEFVNMEGFVFSRMVANVSVSSVSEADSHAQSASQFLSPSMSFWLRNRTILAGRSRFGLGFGINIGVGLRSRRAVTSSTKPTSMKTDLRRPGSCKAG